MLNDAKNCGESHSKFRGGFPDPKSASDYLFLKPLDHFLISVPQFRGFFSNSRSRAASNILATPYDFSEISLDDSVPSRHKPYWNRDHRLNLRPSPVPRDGEKALCPP